MGADIHVYMEYKNDNNEWEYTYIKDQDGDIVDWYNRNYILFGLLANVRREFDCPYTISYRGIPSDVSADVKEQYKKWEDDCHSVTWYTMAELKLISEWVKNYIHEIKAEFTNLKLQGIINLLEDINEINVQIEENLLMQYAIDNFIDFCELISDINFKMYKERRVIIWFDN